MSACLVCHVMLRWKPNFHSRRHETNAFVWNPTAWWCVCRSSPSCSDTHAGAALVFYGALGLSFFLVLNLTASSWLRTTSDAMCKVDHPDSSQNTVISASDLPPSEISLGNKSDLDAVNACLNGLNDMTCQSGSRVLDLEAADAASEHRPLVVIVCG